MMPVEKEQNTGRFRVARVVIPAGIACGLVVGALWGAGARAGESADAPAAADAAQAKPKHKLPAAHKGVVVGLCDGKTSMEVADLAPGERMSKDKAQSVSDQLMAEWRRKNPGANWDQVVAQGDARPSQGNVQATPRPSSAASSSRVSAGPGAVTPATSGSKGKQGGVYENFSSRDEMVWADETQKFIDEGSAIFHNDKRLGGTIGVSCDMCHPNAANTHPETYPKYQIQLQKVALLRDMINWCIENPVKGKPMADDDPRMRALEAYIISQRKGVKMEYGKH